jgi:hypothetical protein
VPLIESQQGAWRLARAIAADIRLYGAEKLARGEVLGDEIEEGRALFRQRVVPSLHPLIEAALAEQQLATGSAAGTLAPVETSPPSALPSGLFEDAPSATPVRARGALPLTLLLAIVVVAAAVGWWLAMRGG